MYVMRAYAFDRDGNTISIYIADRLNVPLSLAQKDARRYDTKENIGAYLGFRPVKLRPRS